MKVVLVNATKDLYAILDLLPNDVAIIERGDLIVFQGVEYVVIQKRIDIDADMLEIFVKENDVSAG